MLIQEPVQAAIWQALNHYAYTDARFLAERLYAEVGSDDALFLLATCYYRSGKPIKAYTLLKNKGANSTQCRYLQAQCCSEINKLAEAETALSGNILTKAKTPEDIISEFGDSASYALSLLAQIYSKTERTAKSIDNYKKSLNVNPFLWSSYEALCNLGEKPDPTKIFHVDDVPSVTVHQQSPYTNVVLQPPTTRDYTPQPRLQSQGNVETPPSQVISSLAHLAPSIPHAVINQITPDNYLHTPEDSHAIVTPTDNLILNPPPSAPSRYSRSTIKGPVGRSVFGGPAALSPLNPSFGVLPLDLEATPGTPQNAPIFNLTRSVLDSSQPVDIKAPIKKPMTRRGQQTMSPKPPVLNQSGTNTSNTNKDLHLSANQSGLQGSNIPNVRRSSRLFSSANSVKENNKTQGRTKFTSPKTPARKSKTRSSKTQQELNEINRAELTPDIKQSLSVVHAQVASMQKQSADGLMCLLRDMGKAYAALAQYDCAKAVEYFSELPAQHYNTGWVLSQVGRSYFEMHEYQKAEKVFSELRTLEPHHIDGMETYSTTLWHLSKEVQLSVLAQELTQTDKTAPQAWIATGNCFSLQKEHDIAIKFFQRAIQVDPNFAYAYTLLGHEYGTTEELDKAMACFRNAIRVNPRHYNAWYGVGMIYFKQGKFNLAEVHFRKALCINPHSSVLLCHVGVAQFQQEHSESAISTLNKAIAADPKNPLCKFNKASILFTNDRHREALKELEELKEIVPKESLVYFLIGKVHKKLGNTHLALMNFSWAMDLDPKGTNNRIKEAIDKRYVTDDEDPATEVSDTGLEASGIESPHRISSNNSSILEAEDVQLQAIESDESL